MFFDTEAQEARRRRAKQQMLSSNVNFEGNGWYT